MQVAALSSLLVLAVHFRQLGMVSVQLVVAAACCSMASARAVPAMSSLVLVPALASLGFHLCSILLETRSVHQCSILLALAGPLLA